MGNMMQMMQGMGGQGGQSQPGMGGVRISFIFCFLYHFFNLVVGLKCFIFKNLTMKS